MKQEWIDLMIMFGFGIEVTLFVMAGWFAHASVPLFFALLFIGGCVAWLVGYEIAHRNIYKGCNHYNKE